MTCDLDLPTATSVIYVKDRLGRGVGIEVNEALSVADHVKSFENAFGDTSPRGISVEILGRPTGKAKRVKTAVEKMLRSKP